MLGLALRPPAEGALCAGFGPRACLLGPDGVPQSVGQPEMHYPLLGPGTSLLGHLGGLRPGQETLIAVAEIAIWPHHLYALHLRAVHISCERGSCQGH